MGVKKVLVGAGTAALLFSGLLIPTAYAGSSLCPAKQVCLYQDNNYSSLLGYRAAGYALMNVTAASNDKMSSWENKSASDARWYHDANGGGKCVNMLSGKSDNDINFLDDNTLSSWATNGHC